MFAVPQAMAAMTAASQRVPSRLVIVDRPCNSQVAAGGSHQLATAAAAVLVRGGPGGRMQAVGSGARSSLYHRRSASIRLATAPMPQRIRGRK
jgi:hypothetical protein